MAQMVNTNFPADNEIVIRSQEIGETTIWQGYGEVGEVRRISTNMAFYIKPRGQNTAAIEEIAVDLHRDAMLFTGVSK
jgi:hypothetical protein